MIRRCLMPVSASALTALEQQVGVAMQILTAVAEELTRLRQEAHNEHREEDAAAAVRIFWRRDGVPLPRVEELLPDQIPDVAEVGRFWVVKHAPFGLPTGIFLSWETFEELFKPRGALLRPLLFRLCWTKSSAVIWWYQGHGERISSPRWFT